MFVLVDVQGSIKASEQGADIVHLTSIFQRSCILILHSRENACFKLCKDAETLQNTTVRKAWKNWTFGVRATAASLIRMASRQI